MALTHSQDLQAGTIAPDFDLPIANPWIDDHDAATRRLSDYAEAEVLVVVFMCNHCPYVVHVEDELVRIANAYSNQGVQLIGISANDAIQYPADSFEAMARRAREKRYPFPYLYDASQAVAQVYGALCTPDVYVFDRHRRLAYHGRIDETRPRQAPAHGGELRQALDELLHTGAVALEARPSMGCNIKWKAGNEPRYRS